MLRLLGPENPSSTNSAADFALSSLSLLSIISSLLSIISSLLSIISSLLSIISSLLSIISSLYSSFHLHSLSAKLRVS